MRRVWIRRTILAVAVLAVVAGFAYALREKPKLVDTGVVRAGPMEVTVREEGVTRVRDVYTISAPIDGHLARTILEEGDPVVANQTVVASIHPLDPPLIDTRTEAELIAARDAARASVGIARIEKEQGETSLRLAEDELDRARKLREPGIISQTALDKAQNEVDLLRARVQAAEASIKLREAELASAEARLMKPAETQSGPEDCCVNILAPIDGVVLDMYVESEQAVVSGARIADIGDPNDLEIAVDLLSSDAVRIAPGAKARITDWGGDRPLRATVRRIDPSGYTKVSALGIEEQRVDAVLDFDETDPRLGHGYRVFAEMTVWSCDSCLTVPISALFRVGGDWNVFVVEGDRARQRRVGIDHMNDEVAEVVEGLSDGDRVVVHPPDTLEDGSLVAARE